MAKRKNARKQKTKAASKKPVRKAAALRTGFFDAALVFCFLAFLRLAITISSRSNYPKALWAARTRALVFLYLYIVRFLVTGASIARSVIFCEFCFAD